MKIILLVALSMSCFVSAAKAAVAAVTIEDFSFLTGYWRGTGLGGTSEEIWMPPTDGRMAGIFRQFEDSQLVFSEFMEIVAINDTFELRLKHFNPDFSGWEDSDEHVTFPLTAITQRSAEFSSLNYSQVTPNHMQVSLRLRDDDGKVHTEMFEFARADSAAKMEISRFGQPHPDAPPQLKEFDFMVGEFSRRDRTRNRDGSWGEWHDGEWNARYFMNGFGIIDESLDYETGLVTSNMRLYDPDLQQWRVTWLTAPSYSTVTAAGNKQGDEIVLISSNNADRYAFSEITSNHYKWTLSILIDGDYVPVREIESTRRETAPSQIRFTP